ncbi:class I SAM-dependent methyltransferase [Alphaproteobacteria bacterium]|nr:class I SAM-dependent methyltransferase [Alphaproteobacteria bacterium]
MASTDIITQKISIKGLGKHSLMPELTSDDSSRLNYQMAFSKFLREEIQCGNKKIFSHKVEPKFISENGRKPKNRHEIRKYMLKNSSYQWWACLRRHLQEQSSSIKFPIVERQSQNLSLKALDYSKKSKYGSLDLDKKIKFPKYQTSMDMHWMPGSYYTEYESFDVFQGAMYDLGGLYVGTGGKMGPFNDGPGWAAVNWIKNKYPKFNPVKILDEGCTVGHSTLAYVNAWPKSEVFGIDFAAPVLRYAHARAESLKKSVHFKQRLAENTKFKDDNFDLVISSMFLHETSSKAIKKLVKEAYRILKPGGLMLHIEQPPFKFLNNTFNEFEMDWDTHNNNEPFWGPMHDMDLENVSLESGFKKNKIFQTFCPFVIPQDDGSIKVIDKGNWFLYGSWK